MRISARGSAPRAAASLHLDAVHLQPAVGERAEHDAAAAADVEHARARREPARQEADVARADQTHRPLDQRLELRAGLPVVFVRIEGADLLRAEHRMEAPEAAAFALDQLRAATPSTSKRGRARLAPHTMQAPVSSAAPERTRTSRE